MRTVGRCVRVQEWRRQGNTEKKREKKRGERCTTHVSTYERKSECARRELITSHIKATEKGGRGQEM